MGYATLLDVNVRLREIAATSVTLSSRELGDLIGYCIGSAVAAIVLFLVDIGLYQKVIGSVTRASIHGAAKLFRSDVPVVVAEVDSL